MTTIQGWLEQFIADSGALAGTVHRRDGEMLALAASVNIPDKVIEVTRQIPRGKGMAGLAWERRQPVSTCNLKTDTSGDVRPGARAVDAQAAVALPVDDAAGELCAVVGIAFRGERDMDDAELAQLQAAAANVRALL